MTNRFTVSACLSAAFALAFAGCHKAPPPAPPPPDVTVLAVEQKDVPIIQEWVANLNGSVDAQIRAQVAGYLLKQDYQEGARVKKGDPLFEIDPRPFKAAVAQAEAGLAQANAQLGKTEQDVKRYTPLAKDQAISQEELDNAIQANLASKALIAAAQATVDNAHLNLEFTHIVSPVDGVAGLVQAQVGDLVGPGTGALTTVSELDPIKAIFPISEQSYLGFQKEHPEADGFPTDVSLSLVLSDGSVYGAPGKFFAVDRQIDPSTGALQVVAVFPNPKNALRPGQYGRVRAVVRTVKGALVVPTRALSELQGSFQLTLVDKDNKAHVKAVKVGAAFGTLSIIEAGVQAGDTVIIEGFQKVKEGGAVNPKPYQAAQ